MSDWIDSWLGAARFAPYLEKASNDRQLGIDLYEWNSELGAALMHDIAHFEVAMRNSYDGAVSEHWTGPGHWLLSPDSPAVTPIWRVREVHRPTRLRRGVDVNYLNRRSVDAAINKSGRGHATPGKVMAELSFGFWSHLTSNASEKTLWVPYLHHAYPAGTNRKTVDAAISRINTVRNRIAHHEPIFDRPDPLQEPSALHADLLRTLQLLAPAVHTHVVNRTRVAEVVAQRPC